MNAAAWNPWPVTPWDIFLRRPRVEEGAAIHRPAGEGPAARDLPCSNKVKLLWACHALVTFLFALAFFYPSWFTFRRRMEPGSTTDSMTGAGGGEEGGAWAEQGLWEVCEGIKRHSDCRSTGKSHGQGLAGQVLLALSLVFIFKGLVLASCRAWKQSLNRYKLPFTFCTLIGGVLGIFGTYLFGLQSHEDKEHKTDVDLSWCYYLSLVCQVVCLILGLGPFILLCVKPRRLTPGRGREGQGGQEEEEEEEEEEGGPPLAKAGRQRSEPREAIEDRSVSAGSDESRPPPYEEAVMYPPPVAEEIEELPPPYEENLGDVSPLSSLFEVYSVQSSSSEAGGDQPSHSEGGGSQSLFSETGGSQHVPNEASDNQPLPSEAEGTEPVHPEAKGNEPLPSEAKGNEPLSSEAKGNEPLSSEAKGNEPLPSVAKGNEPLPSEAKGNEPLSSEAKGNEPLSSEAKGNEPLPSEAKDNRLSHTEVGASQCSTADDNAPNASDSTGPQLPRCADSGSPASPAGPSEEEPPPSEASDNPSSTSEANGRQPSVVDVEDNQPAASRARNDHSLRSGRGGKPLRRGGEHGRGDGGDVAETSL